jgi:hypothetical protein
MSYLYKARKLVAISGYPTTWASLLAMQQSVNYHAWGCVIRMGSEKWYPCLNSSHCILVMERWLDWNTGYQVVVGEAVQSVVVVLLQLHFRLVKLNWHMDMCCRGKWNLFVHSAVCAHHVGIPELWQRMPNLPSSWCTMQHYRAHSL